MKRIIKIVLGCIVWSSWYVTLFIITDPKYVSEPLLSLPITNNPFVLLKWFLWDNPRVFLVSLSFVILASCTTYTYAKLFDSVWSPKKEEK